MAQRRPLLTVLASAPLREPAQATVWVRQSTPPFSRTPAMAGREASKWGATAPLLLAGLAALAVKRSTYGEAGITTCHSYRTYGHA